MGKKDKLSIFKDSDRYNYKKDFMDFLDKYDIEKINDEFKFFAGMIQRLQPDFNKQLKDYPFSEDNKKIVETLVVFIDKHFFLENEQKVYLSKLFVDNTSLTSNQKEKLFHKFFEIYSDKKKKK